MRTGDRSRWRCGGHGGDATERAVSPVPPLEPALRLAISLLHSHWVLQEPADRLTVPATRAVARELGFPEVAASLRDDDLPHLRALRERLHAVFAAPDPVARVATLN